MIHKGVIHIHSNHSYDGKLSLLELKNFLLERGISFACMTEHTDFLDEVKSQKFIKECRDLSDEDFVFIPGFEVPYKDAHVLHIGATHFVSSKANSAQLKFWRKVSPWVILAHPVRNKFIVDAELFDCIDGVEIWNQQYEGKLVPRKKSLKLLKRLRLTKELLATGGLDLHRREHFGSPFTIIDLDTLEEESILDKLKAGQYSFGNEGKVIGAQDNWQGDIKDNFKSRYSILLIDSGKAVNKILAKFGLSLPKKLKIMIRSSV